MNHAESELDFALEQKTSQLLAMMRSFEFCVVAFSAGVDSTVVAQAAQISLGQRALAATGVSPSLAEGELQEARRLADQIGIQHVIVETNEFAKPAYLRNAADRCYHCKSELYALLETLCEQHPTKIIVNGANQDDHNDYRPGMKAARERRVRSPLVECGFTKDDVRRLAKHWNLPVWNKPASPCLSSRIAYGEEVTPARLSMVDRAEQLLRALGFSPVRVRYHPGDMARIEIPAEMLVKVTAPGVREQILSQFQNLGFRFVTLDLAGFQSGSLNALLSPETLELVELKPG